MVAFEISILDFFSRLVQATTATILWTTFTKARYATMETPCERRIFSFLCVFCYSCSLTTFLKVFCDVVLQRLYSVGVPSNRIL